MFWVGETGESGIGTGHQSRFDYELVGEMTRACIERSFLLSKMKRVFEPALLTVSFTYAQGRLNQAIVLQHNAQPAFP